MLFFSSRRRHTRCALVTGVQTCALPILRKAVLRRWLTPEEARETWADAAEHCQVGALKDGRVVSTAGFLIEAQPDYGEVFGPLQWRLRGMASEPALQGQGIGGRVLDFGIEIGRAHV